MALKYNGTTIPGTGTVKYNGTSLTKVIYNGTTVWTKDNNKYLFDNGTLNNAFEGVAVNGFGWGWEGCMNLEGTITTSGSTMTFTGNTSHYDSVFSKSSFDYKKWKSLKFTVSSASDVQIGATSDGKVIGYNGPYTQPSTSSTKTYTVDLSELTANFKIACCIKGKGSVTFTKIWLVPK